MTTSIAADILFSDGSFTDPSRERRRAERERRIADLDDQAWQKEWPYDPEAGDHVMPAPEWQAIRRLREEDAGDPGTRGLRTALRLWQDLGEALAEAERDIIWADRAASYDAQPGREWFHAPCGRQVAWRRGGRWIVDHSTVARLVADASDSAGRLDSVDEAWRLALAAAAQGQGYKGDLTILATQVASWMGIDDPQRPMWSELTGARVWREITHRHGGWHVGPWMVGDTDSEPCDSLGEGIAVANERIDQARAIFRRQLEEPGEPLALLALLVEHMPRWVAIWATQAQIDEARDDRDAFERRDPDRQLRLPEAARRLAVKTSVVRRAIQRDTFPAPDGHIGATPWWSPRTVDACREQWRRTAIEAIKRGERPVRFTRRAEGLAGGGIMHFVTGEERYWDSRRGRSLAGKMRTLRRIDAEAWEAAGETRIPVADRAGKVVGYLVCP
jgi:predicted DNA-binding transcriptional regulator AlpA